MGKVLKIIGTVVGVVGLAVVTGGAALGLGLSLATAIGPVTAGALLAVGAGLSVIGGLLTKSPKISSANADRTSVSIDPRTPRKIIFGHTAMATDLRDQEWSADQAYLHRFVVVASHKVQSIDEIWFDDKLAWSAGGGVSSTYAGYLDVSAITEGSAANAINIGARMGSARRYTGLAYVYFRYKTTGNSKKSQSPFANSIPTRVTIIGKGMAVYDPRRDSTVPGGSGSQRANDQTTWAWDDDAARNPALQLLTYLLGWRIRNPTTGAWRLAVGKGLPPARIDLASFAIAANLCDETVAKSGGGTEPRYRGDGILSEGDELSTVLDTFKATMNADVDDADGRLRLVVYHNDLASPIGSLDDDDVLGDVRWTPATALSDTITVVRGNYTDPSTSSLYQAIAYPDIVITPADGIERAVQVDLPLVQSPSQAQRLGKQRLQRALYPGVFEATFQATAWKFQKADVIRLTFSALGFSNKLFRIVAMTVRVDGRVPMLLREENAAIYGWDASDAPAISAADPTTYDPLRTPVNLELLDLAATPNNVNLIRDARFERGMAAWVASVYSGTQTSSYPLIGTNLGKAYLEQAGDFAAGGGGLTIIQAADQSFPCTSGQRFAVQGKVRAQSVTAAVRYVSLRIQWWDASGAYITETAVQQLAGAQAFGTLIAGFATAPALAASGRLILYADTVGSGQIAALLAEPMVTVATPDQTQVPDFAVGPSSGLSGTNGLNNATVFAFLRAASTPAGPSATTTYTFATGALTGLNNGWSTSVPAANGNPLYVIAATASATTATDTIAAAEWSGAVIQAQDGGAGSPGTNGLNNAPVFLFKRATSAPAVPSATLTYTFATSLLSGTLSGWTQSVPAGTDPIYVITATALGSGATDTIASAEWATPNVLAQNGISPIVGYLTNENHTVTSAADGTGYSLADAGGTFKVFVGTIDVTTSAAFSIVGGANVVGTINATTGVYSFTTLYDGPAYVDFRASISGVNIDKRYTISKSRAGADGSPAKLLTVGVDRQLISFDGTGALSPSSQTATFTATRQNSTATVTWSMTTSDGTALTASSYLSATTGLSVTMTAAAFNSARGTAQGVIVTATMTDGTTLSDRITVLAARAGADGINGASGLNNATVFAFKRSASVPAGPSLTTTYTFATAALTGLNNGWSTSVPAADGNPLYVIAATASATGATDTIAAAEWASPVIQTQDGAAGAAGLNVAPVFLYKRATSAPAVPAATLTYTFATSLLSGTLSGWTQTVPSGTDPIYVTTATALSTGTTDTIASAEWATPNVLAQNGIDGAPGADKYVWIAYADSFDGSVNFTTGSPGGRTWIGIAVNQTSGTEGTTPSAYTWSQYAGPPNFGLVAGANCIVSGSKVIKVSGGASYNGQVYSSESYYGGAFVSCRVETTTDYSAIGLNTDPTTDAGLNSIDYAINVALSTLYVVNNGTFVYNGPTIAAGDVVSIQYDGSTVRYAKNGVEFYNQSASAGQRLWLDSTLGREGHLLTIQSWTAAGAAGARGDNGAPGADKYVWIAYADSSDGSVNFTTGAPGGRGWIGIATNQSTATESTSPGAYSWSQYAGPPNFGLIATNGVVVSGSKVIKPTADSAWNGQVYSSESYFGGAFVSFRVEVASGVYYMIGLNSDPTTDANYTSIDYAVYVANGDIGIVNNGSFVYGGITSVAAGDVLSAHYDGATVRYAKNGVQFHSQTASPGLRLWLDSAVYSAGHVATIQSWAAAGAVGANGINAITGYLTNDNVTVESPSGGGTITALSEAGGTFKVFSGTTDVTTSASFSVIGGAWIAGTINATTGVYSFSAYYDGAPAYADFQAVYGGVTIVKRYSITRARAGAAGAAAVTSSVSLAAAADTVPLSGSTETTIASGSFTIPSGGKFKISGGIANPVGQGSQLTIATLRLKVNGTTVASGSLGISADGYIGSDPTALWAGNTYTNSTSGTVTVSLTRQRSGPFSSGGAQYDIALLVEHQP